MKNILLFEAFNSKTITSVLKYLTKEERSRVISDLKDIMSKYNYPIDKIDDNYISYNRISKALSLIPTGENDYYIKYFYNKEGKRITKTITKSIEELKKISEIPTKNCKTYRGIDLKERLDDDFKLPKGYKYTFVCRYNSKASEYKQWFNTGDKILIIFDCSEDISRKVKPVEATIFRDSDLIYAIQNNQAGSCSNNDEWMKYGTKSWSISSNHSIDSSHVVIAIDDDRDRELYPEFNFDNSSSINNLYKDADFAVTVKVSDILNSDFERVDKKKSNRLESRKDALALISDEDIIRNNKKRIDSFLLSKLGFGKYKNGQLVNSNEKLELKDLQKLLLHMLRSANKANQFAYERLYSDSINVTLITDLITKIIENVALNKSGKKETNGELLGYLSKNINKFMNDQSGLISVLKSYGLSIDDLVNYQYGESNHKTGNYNDDNINLLVRKFSNIRKDSIEDTKTYKDIYNALDSMNKRKNTYKFFKVIRELSNKIGDYVRNQNITCVDDLILLEIKLDSIARAVNRFRFERNVQLVLNGVKNVEDVEVENKDLEKLKLHQKYINSLLG